MKIWSFSSKKMRKKTLHEKPNLTKEKHKMISKQNTFEEWNYLENELYKSRIIPNIISRSNNILLIINCYLCYSYIIFF